MEAAFIFILKMSGCLAIFYGAYLLIFRNDTNFKIQRFFLLASVVFSILLAFNNYALRQYQTASYQANIAITAPAAHQEPEIANQQLGNVDPKGQKPYTLTPQNKSTFDIIALVKWLYVSITIFLLIRIVLGFFKLFILLVSSKRTTIFETRIYQTKMINGSSNVFGFIFLNPSLTQDPKLSQIILHEKIHASQYHSIDILLAELLAAAMWFNPVVWFMRRSLQQIHEYLADEGVLHSGINKLEYQELLINQIAEENLLLSSGFQSSIKKRMIMMTKTKESKQTKSKLLTLLPLIAILIAGISFINAPAQEKQPVKQNTQVKFVPPQTSTAKSSKVATTKTTKTEAQEKVKFKPPVIVEEIENPQEPPMAAISLTAMNVIYLGVDNPVDIAVSGVSSDKVRVSITNGSVVRSGNSYIIRPKTLQNAIVSVDALINGKWENVKNMDFRVKRVPDPVATIEGKKSGLIQKDFLSSQDKISVLMENFDFNLKFIITEFTVSTNVDGITKDLHSKSNKITPEQKELINKAKSGQKIYFIDMKCVGPDGGIRELPPMMFEIL